MMGGVLRSGCFAVMMSAVITVLTFGASPGFAQSTDVTVAKADHLHHDQCADLGNVPERARIRRNPLTDDPDAAVAGKKLFEQHCAECHGEAAEGGKGGKKGPSLRAVEVQNATPGTLFWVLTNGVVRRGMPVWSKLPEPQRWQIVRFLKTLRPGEPAQ